MKPPDLSMLDAAGVREWKGPVEPLKAAAAQAKLGFAVIDLSKARDKATLFGEIDRQLKLPEHFGHNWDALADVLEDRDWLGKHGRAVVLAHAPPGARTIRPNGRRWRTSSPRPRSSGRSGTSRSGCSSPERSSLTCASSNPFRCWCSFIRRTFASCCSSAPTSRSTGNR